MATTTPESGGPQALVSMSSPVYKMENPPLLILSLSNIPLISIPPVGHLLIRFLVDPQHTKQDHSPSGGPDDHLGKRAHAKTTEATVSSVHSAPQRNRELSKTPTEAPSNGVGASGSTEEDNSKDNTDHGGNESTQDESRENAADSDLELASGDCLTCSDMKEMAIRTTKKRFQKRLWASCSIVRGCLWSEFQVR